MTGRVDVWADGEVAHRYRRYAAHHRTYSWTSGRLLQEAGVRPGERVVDLGCGTGVTSRMAKDIVGERGTVVGVDASEAMLDQARRDSRPGLRFVQGRVEELDADAVGEVDVFASNMAMWQFDVAQSLDMLWHLSSAGTRLTFTVGTWADDVAGCRARQVVAAWTRDLDAGGWRVTRALHVERPAEASALREWLEVGIAADPDGPSLRGLAERAGHLRLCCVVIVALPAAEPVCPPS